jgi:amino acid transporter
MAGRKQKFGTFQGVFVPTLLTILGIILFLRLPWVVGNAGIGGALIIIIISVGITLLTTLSLSSIITNIQIGAGGAFSIISRSLGLEIGGSIGIPLYLSQAIVVAMYIFGFREGWLWIFPDHNALFIDFGAFAFIFLIALLSTKLAFKIQYVILAVVIIAIVSVIIGFFQIDKVASPQFIGDFVEAEEGEIIGAKFWLVFAVFFPAVTGIMAGLNMSGELKNPRKSIPIGTLWAVGLTTLVYVLLAILASYMGTTDELRNNYTFFVDNAFLPILVLIGLLGATISSAMTSFIGAPRVLEAIAENNVVPFSKQLKQKSKTGEPIYSIIFTGIIVVIALLLRELNVIAPLITMFFLITYAMINLVVLVEQSLALPSFRPTFGIPKYVPLLGTLGCFFVMFIINPIFSFVAIVGVLGIYVFLMKRKLDYEGGYARSGLFTALAKWATEKSIQLSHEHEPKSWQPDLLVPVLEPREVRASFKLLHAIVHPKGSLKVIGVGTGKKLDNLKNELPPIIDALKEGGKSVHYSLIESNEFSKSVEIGLGALDAAYFKPNSIFLRLDNKVKDLTDYQHIIETAKIQNRGVLLYVPFAKVGIGLEQTVNLWLTEIPQSWINDKELGNNDLSVLMAILIHDNWKNSKLNIILETEKSEQEGKRLLNKLKMFARLPKNAVFQVINRAEKNKWEKIPQADLNIASIHNIKKLENMMKEVVSYRSSFLYTLDSGKENAQV